MPYIGYEPAKKPLTSADITDGVITSASISDGTIVNADVSSSAAIALSKLSTTGTASSSNYLRGDGAWTAVSSDYVLLASTSSSGSTISIDGYFSSTYKFYKIIFDVYNTSSATNLVMRFNNSGSADSSSVYTWSNRYNAITSGGSFPAGSDGLWSSTYLKIANGSGDVNYRTAGEITLMNPQSTNYQTAIWNATSFNDTSNHYHYVGGGQRRSTTASTGVTFYFDNTGTLTTRFIALYGIK